MMMMMLLMMMSSSDDDFGDPIWKKRIDLRTKKKTKKNWYYCSPGDIRLRSCYLLQMKENKIDLIRNGLR